MPPEVGFVPFFLFDPLFFAFSLFYWKLGALFETASFSQEFVDPQLWLLRLISCLPSQPSSLAGDYSSFFSVVREWPISSTRAL